MITPAVPGPVRTRDDSSRAPDSAAVSVDGPPGHKPLVPPTIAFLGTGIMGLPMARNLVKAGFALRVWNRTAGKAAPLADDGATVCQSTPEAVTGADVVITMLFDADTVLSAMADAWSAVPDNAVWLQMTTVGVAGCQRLAAAAGEHRLAFVDAPVLGTRKPAEDGTLKIFAAGPTELRDRVEPVLAPMGSLAHWFDQVGQGSALKMVVNTWVLFLTDATASSIALARGLGLDPQLFLDMIGSGPTDCPYAHVKGAMMIDGTYPPSFALSGALKDAGLIVEAAGSAQLDSGPLQAIRVQLQRAVDDGHADEDMAAVYTALDPARAERK